MAKWQRIKIQIPKEYKPIERQVIGQEIVDFIVNRTLEGKNKKNRSFKGYSESYKKSLDYKIAGKKGNVNLRLSGEMLNELQVLSHKSGEVTIGFDKNDKELNGKAEGNILGTYGKKTPSGKARDFLGITKKDLNKKILSNFPIKDKETRLNNLYESALVQQAADNTTDDIVAELERAIE